MAKQDFPKFYDYLFQRTPEWDEKVSRGMFEPYICPLPCDMRLLPNLLRKVYAAKPPKRRRKLKRRSAQRFYQKYDLACSLLNRRLELWLCTLPKKRQEKERKRRTVDPQNTWIGKTEVAPWPDEDKASSPWQKVKVHGQTATAL